MHNDRTGPIACFQWLRLLAALAVVVMHTEGQRWMSISHESTEWMVLTLYDGFVRWPVPVFLMITGALFLPRVTSLKTALKRYIPRMALAFFLWSGVYALYGLYRGASLGDTLLKFVGGEYHLWYLPFLCGIYLVLPFVQKIVTDENLERQLLATSMVIGLGIPWLADLLAALVPGSAAVVRSLENSLHYTFFFDHLSLLLLGHFLYRKELTGGQRRTLYVLGLLSMVLTGPATVWLSRRTGFQNSLFCDHGSPTTLLAAAAIFVFAKSNLTRLPKMVDRLAKRSFGIYLSHVLVIDLLAALGCHCLTLDPVWFLPVLSAAVFALSAALTAVLAHIPVLGKILT